MEFPDDIELMKVAEAVDDLQRNLGLPVQDTYGEQLMTSVEAFAIFARHTKEIGELWKEVDTENIVHHIKHKSDRLFHVEVRLDRRNTEFAIDSALDLINYAIFYIRKIREEERLS